MNFKEIQDLVRLVKKMDLVEFKMKDGEFELSIRTEKYYEARNKAGIAATPSILPVQPAMSAPVAAVAPAPAPVTPAPESAPAAESADTSNLLEIKSPMVGTFYRSSSPDKDAYAKVGDVIEKGATVCIVEAMKLFNEIESEISGKIVKVMVEDAQPVEYDQVLFLVDPKG